MKEKHALAHMKAAEAYAECSTAKRLQVGCIIVKDDRVISIGYNGTPSGWSSNVCEDHNFDTKDEVIHAEENAIAKLAGCHESGKGAIVFCTHAPCLSCAKLLHQVGIAEIYYRFRYRSDRGLLLFQEMGIPIYELNDNTGKFFQRKI
jgi:dCMP deaminase